MQAKTIRLFTKPAVPVLIIASIASISGLVMIFNPYAGFAISVMPLLLWAGLADKKNVLFIFLLILPYHNSSLLTADIMGITGAKPFNLMAAFMLVLFFFHGGRLFRYEDEIGKKALRFFYLYIIVFAITLFRSLDHLDLLYLVSPETFHRSPVNHILTFFVRPALFTIPFIYVLKFIKTEKEIEQCVNVICLSVFVLSCFVLTIAIVNIDRIIVSRVYAGDIISSFFSVHYNALGSIYMTCIPLLVLRSLDRSLFSLINFSLAGLAVIFLQSRSAIAVFVIGTIILLYFLKKGKEIIFLGYIVLILLILAGLPEFLVRVLSIGLESGDLDEFFMGRIDNIWIPIIMERLGDPGRLFLGAGSFSMLISQGYLQGEIQLGHAHNAFLEIFIDCGLLVFAGFLFCLVLFLIKAWSLAKKVDTPLGWALFTCLATYLVGTISGRNFYPTRNSMYLFPVIALLINYSRVYYFSGKQSEERRCK